MTRRRRGPRQGSTPALNPNASDFIPSFLGGGDSDAVPAPTSALTKELLSGRAQPDAEAGDFTLTTVYGSPAPGGGAPAAPLKAGLAVAPLQAGLAAAPPGKLAVAGVPPPVLVNEEQEWDEAADELSSRLNLDGQKEVASPIENSTLPDVAGPSGREEKLGPDSFELLRVVGQGAFGKVFQVRHKMTRNVYAMKVMQKDRIVERGHQGYVEMEREVLTGVDHPYVINLRFAFQTKSKLYIVMDFVNGGHLFFKLWNEGIFDESETRLMAAEIVLAVSKLHELGIAHRDLKPENILLDNEGHIKITDFGLAKKLGPDTRTNSFIGTMEYMAPEIIKGDGHGKEVDWWSTGILVYEMLSGRPPFEAQSRQTLQKQIVGGKIKIPKFFSSPASSLIKGLLTRDVSKRLGSGPNGARDIKQHAFFRGIDWKALEQGKVTSPFRPAVSPMHDCVKNFDKIWTDMAPVDSPCSSPKKEHAFQFEDFNYKSPSIKAS